MSSTIQANGLLIAMGVLSLAGCKRPEPQPDAPVVVASQQSPTSSAAPAVAKADAAQVPEAVSRVVALEDIAVAGRPACAMTVRYASLADQPVTWQGEHCGSVTIAFMTLGQLEKLGQAGKLSAEQRDDVVALPGSKALYIEGEFASAIYPANAAQRIYSVSLAD